METKTNPYFIPGAIIIAGLFIAGAMFFSGNNSDKQAAIGDSTFSISDIQPVDGNDHILGDPEALITIVEFSDLECPYCKQFHLTLKKIVEEFPNDVRWVYRHFPLDNLHSKARKEAEASECANELGGNDAFWSYVDNLFEITPSNDGLELSLLPQIAEDIGLDREEFVSCLDSGKYADLIEEDYQDGVTIGVKGTPYSVIMLPGGEFIPLNGVLPYEEFRGGMEQIISEF